MIHLKEKSIGSPKHHLGNKVSQVELENGVKCWSFICTQHAQAAAKDVECFHSSSDLGPLPNNE